MASEGFALDDFGVSKELHAAAVVLERGDCAAFQDEEISRLTAAVFRQWAHMGEFAPDFLNRVGGAETVALARYINATQRSMEK